MQADNDKRRQNMIIGIDHGYGYIKTRNRIFAAGVAAFDYEPPVKTRIVSYGGRYYQAGCMPDGLAGDKTVNDDYYILTLAGIAEEMKIRKANTGEITIAAGIPLTRYGAEKEALTRYLTRHEYVKYCYEDAEYNIRIMPDIYIYPQGYSAIAPKLNDVKGSCTLVDIGTGTTEIVPISGGEHIPDLKRCKTLQYGVADCIAMVNEEVSRAYQTELMPDQITDIMLGRATVIPEAVKRLVENTLAAWCDTVLSQLRQNKVNYELTQTFIMGGGAGILDRYSSGICGDNECITIITDIRANAAGYELLANAQSGKGNR